MPSQDFVTVEGHKYRLESLRSLAASSPVIATKHAADLAARIKDGDERRVQECKVDGQVPFASCTLVWYYADEDRYWILMKNPKSKSVREISPANMLRCRINEVKGVDMKK